LINYSDEFPVFVNNEAVHKQKFLETKDVLTVLGTDFLFEHTINVASQSTEALNGEGKQNKISLLQ
jgi:hypothetical protein